MRNLSRGAWLAIAAIAAVPATVAIAKTAQHADWRLSPETRSRLEDGRLAMVKVALRLTPDQEKHWSPLEQQVRDTFKAHEAKRAERIEKRKERKAEQTDKREHKHRDLAARYQKVSQRLSDRAERIEKRKERKAEQTDKREHKHRDLAARYEKISQRLSDRAERVKAFSAAFTPFYASLSDEQKAALRPLMRNLAPGIGRHSGHGSR
jgi:DNA repair exonuclease SbcCD ATPase subunit